MIKQYLLAALMSFLGLAYFLAGTANATDQLPGQERPAVLEDANPDEDC
jgi:hypothetical protein